MDFEALKDEYHYSAHFKSSIPMDVAHPNARNKVTAAKIVLGIFQWQKSFDRMKLGYPTLTLEKYNEMRKKYNIK